MAVVNPIPEEATPEQLKGLYENVAEKFGKIPNMFRVMAHRPSALQSFLPFYGAVMQEGTIEPKLKELAYLKTTQLNGCEY